MSQLKINKFKKKYTISIPKNIGVTYCNIKNIIIFSNKFKKKFIKLNVKLLLMPEKHLIVVTSIPVAVGSKNFKKLQGTTVSAIRQLLIELSYPLFIKLSLIGVGYRVFFFEQVKNQIYFKLGYSHLIYFKIPENFQVFCQKFVKIFIYGDNTYHSLTQTAAQIRLCKIPEVYKGKGILYENENIILKKGKKV